MMLMAIRSSTTASVSRKIRSALGRCEPMIASTATAKAMSVAVGIAQPRKRFRAGEVDQRIDNCRDRHTSDCRRDGHHGFAELAQVSGHELTFELQPHQEEEDRQQTIGCPGPQAQFQMPWLVADA